MKNIGSWFVFSVTAGLIAVFLYNNRQIFARLHDIQFHEGAVLLVATLLAPVFNAFKFYFSSRAYGFMFAYRECFSLVSSCSLYNYVLPSNAGSVFRAIYLKKVFAFPYSRYVSMTLFINLVSLVVCFVAAILLLFWVDIKLELPYLEGLVIVMLLLAIIGFMLLNNHGVRQVMRSKLDMLPEFDAHFLSGSAGLVLVHLVFVVFSAFRLGACFQIMGVDLSMHHYILIQCVLAVALVYNLTPGNIGVAEGAICSLMLMFGVDVATSLAAALLDRFVIFLVLSLYGMASIWHLNKLKASHKYERRRNVVT